MEVDEIQRQVSKFQRVSSNGSSTTTTDHNLLLNNQKIATSRGNLELQNHHHVDDSVVGGGGAEGVGIGGGIARLCGWPSSRIVRVSRASGGKDRHSKVLTSKGLRDRRVRLSVSTAIQFYDLQDRLGFDQPSKAVEWLLKAAASSIDELPSLDPSFSGVMSEQCRVQVVEDKKLNENCNGFEDLNFHHHQVEHHQQQNNSNNKKDGISEVKWKAQSKSNSKSKSPDCSSTSETSKGSGLSLSRSENRMKARERAREMASKKEKNIVLNHNQQNNLSENSSFTDLLTSGINTSVRRSPETRNHWSTTQPPPPQPMDYFFSRPPQFNITAIDNHHHHHHNHFSFLQDTFIPTAVPTTTTTGGGNGESYNLNFSMTSSSSSAGGVALAPGFSRGTLQSNLPYLQRFQSSSSIDGSPSTNLPFFIVPNNVSDHFPATTGGYHLSYGGGGGGDHHHKDKPKN